MDRRVRELAERFAELNAAEAKNIAAIRHILNDLSRLIASTRMDPPEAGRRMSDLISGLALNLNDVEDIEKREAAVVSDMERRAHDLADALQDASRMFQSKLQQFL
jgi:hypothetical protein